MLQRDRWAGGEGLKGRDRKWIAVEREWQEHVLTLYDPFNTASCWRTQAHY